MKSTYQTSKPLEQRIAESNAMKEKYPDRVCVICEKSVHAGDIPNIDKVKYLVPNTITVGQFMYIIRKRLNVDSGKCIFFFINDNFLPPTSAVMIDLYAKYKNEDGLLYFTYATENTFG